MRERQIAKYSPVSYYSKSPRPPASHNWDRTKWPCDFAYRLLGRARKVTSLGWTPWANSANYAACVADANPIYWASTGSDGSGTGTSGSPYGTMDKAVQVANASAVARTIVCDASKTQTRGSMTWLTTPPTVPLRILFRGGVSYFGMYDTGYTWAADGTYTNLFKPTPARSAVGMLVDMSRIDRFGCPERYINAKDLASANIRPGSRFNDGTTEYLFPRDGNTPTDLTARPLLNTAFWVPTQASYTAPQDLFIEGETDADGFEIMGGTVAFTPANYASADRIIAMRRGCIKLAQRGPGGVGRGVAFDNWRGMVWLENMQILGSGDDGFNTHNTLNTQPTHLVSIGNIIKNSGVYGTNSVNNFTMHENTIGWGVGNEYDTSAGRNIGNINTTCHTEHGSIITNDRGDKQFSLGNTLVPMEIGLANTAKIALSECEIIAAAGGYWGYNPAGTEIAIMNMVASVGKLLNPVTQFIPGS